MFSPLEIYTEQTFNTSFYKSRALWMLLFWHGMPGLFYMLTEDSVIVRAAMVTDEVFPFFFSNYSMGDFYFYLSEYFNI